MENGSSSTLQQMIAGYEISEQQYEAWSALADAPQREICQVTLGVEVDGDSLRTALAEMVARHEILRTGYRLSVGMSRPWQIISPSGFLGWREETEAIEAAAVDGSEPALQACLRRRGLRDYQLWLSLPKLSVDRQSWANLVQDLERRYKLLRAGKNRAPEDEEDILQYAAYAAWQRELIDAEEAADGRAYWRGLPIKAQAGARLALEREGREARRDSQLMRVEIGKALAAEAAELSRSLGISEESTLLTCWQILLWKLTGGGLSLVGVGFNGRTDVDMESALGLFERRLPVSFEGAAKSGLRGLLRQTNEKLEEYRAWLDCFRWSYLGGGAEESEWTGDLEYGFEYVSPEEKEEGDGSGWTLEWNPGKEADCKLRLCCRRRGAELRAELNYDPARYEDGAIRHLAQQYLSLLRNAAKNPEKEWKDLELIGAEEREELLVKWNQTGVEWGAFRPLHQWFEEQAKRSAESAAVEFGLQRLSYRELNERANRLARRLRRLGVGPETVVGVLMERSLEMVVGILGTLKAGAAYLPLDASYPEQRLSYMVKDAGIGVLLTQERLLDKAAGNGAEVICVDRDWDEIAGESGENLGVMVEKENLAYVIYTSGSTGRPKGAMITHGAIWNHMEWMQKEYPLGEEDSVLQKTPFSFDASVWEFYAPLLAGGKLVMAEPGGHRDPGYLVKAMEKSEVSVLQVVPTLLRALLEEGGLEKCRKLKRLYCGGEKLGVDLMEKVGVQAPQARLINLYGPTETCIDAIWWEAGEAKEGRSVAIGKPISNMKAYVLDERMRLAAVGTEGELYLGGVGLGRGYLGRAEVTADRFVPNPFGERGERMYRTGDVVVRRAGGELEYVSRLDRQVKLRGRRIELGEVEVALKREAGVRQSVALVREDKKGVAILVGYVVREEGRPIDEKELRRKLQESLPEYMAPAEICALDSLPLLPNGKIDFNALPETGTARAGMNENGTAPRTPTEDLLSGIWQSALGVSRVGIHDNFFDLGGHSLMATTVAARIRDAFQVELPLRRLFERPTVSALASDIDEEIRDGKGLRVSPIVATRRDGELPLSFAQRRLWFLDQLSPGSASNNIPGGARLKGALDVEALEKAISEIIRRHENLRARLITRHGDPLQTIDEPRPWTLPMEDLSHLSGAEIEAEVQQRAASDAGRPFDLSQAPLLRIKLLRLGQDDHALLITMHHIISDGWSLGVFVRELATLYEAFREGRQSPLPELSIQYGDYAVWQRTQFQGEELERHAKYWKRRLKGAPPLLELPADRPRPEKQRFRGAVRSIALSKGLTDSAKALGRDENATLFMTLLAAFNILLWRRAGREDIVVGTDVANRNRVETENLIGFFVNQLVLRTDLSGNPTFREILRRVREVTLDAYGRQDMPFDKLVEVLNPERSLKYSPIFQTKLVLQNAPAPPLELANVSLEEIPIKSGVSRFDLTLLFWEEKDGLKGAIEYNADLFDETSIARLGELFEMILQFVAGKPQASLSEIKETIAAFEREKLREQAPTRAGNDFKRFQSVKPKVVRMERENIVRTSRLRPDLSAPLVIEPVSDDADLVDWTRNNLEFIERELREHGALLFRGFSLGHDSEGAGEFEKFARTICPDLFRENGEHPRETLRDGVYTPVFYPADKKLLWHNENSFNLQWPMKIWFCCAKPADDGGETPIVDSRKVFDSIAPAIRERFIQKGVMYVRNYAESLGLSWQQVFRTTAKTVVEERCRRENIDFEWKAGDRLVTRSIRPAVGRHPRTGAMVWFNQSQHWHLSCLDRTTRESLQSLFKEEDLPRNCYYGDGSAIGDSDMAEILDVYRNLEISFPWRKWDIMMLDNMLTAHARNPFTGERKLLVAMGEMSSYLQA